MSTKPELYREVFGTQAGREVLADLAAYTEKLAPTEPGSKVIAHITRMMNTTERVAETKPRGTRASGGRIQHG